MSFTIAIIGRPNVGKSTLFNRLIGNRQAIVDDVSGVTRDRQYGVSDWGGKLFDVIDTGGFVPNSDDLFEKAIAEQVQIAISEADLLLFMVDVTTGITDLDDAMADLLRRSSKKVIVVVNKVDNSERLLLANEFYSFGFEHNIFLSSINGSGTGELLDLVIDFIPSDAEEDDENAFPKFTIVGQPNVGKSSFLNALVGEERNIVTEIAGTTRDTISTHYSLFQKDFILIDTAGIRKKAKVHENLEFYSVIRAIRSMDEADVVLLLIDANNGIEAQDVKIFSLAEKKKKGIVILANKWDLVSDKETNSLKEKENDIRERIAPFTDVPIIFMSVHEKQRIFKAIETAIDVYKNLSLKIPTSVLNEWLEESLQRNHPPAVRGKLVTIKYVTQLPTKVPSFAFFTNHPKHIREPYRNYLENRLRDKFNLTGVPINIFFRQK